MVGAKFSSRNLNYVNAPEFMACSRGPLPHLLWSVRSTFAWAATQKRNHGLPCSLWAQTMGTDPLCWTSTHGGRSPLSGRWGRKKNAEEWMEADRRRQERVTRQEQEATDLQLATADTVPAATRAEHTAANLIRVWQIRPYNICGGESSPRIS